MTGVLHSGAIFGKLKKEQFLKEQIYHAYMKVCII